MRSRKDKCAFQSVPIEDYEFYKSATRELEQENKELKDNWNKLRDYLFDIRQRVFELQNLADINNNEPTISVLMILDKMQEIEKGEK